MRSGLGQMMRTLRDAPDHRQPSLRTSQTRPCRSVSCLVSLVEEAMPLGQLPGRLVDAFDPTRPVDQLGWDPIAIIVLVLVRAGILARVGLVGFGDHCRCLFSEPGLAPVSV